MDKFMSNMILVPESPEVFAVGVIVGAVIALILLWLYRIGDK